MKSLMNWFEIPALNISRAADFYNNLLDLNMEVIDCGPEKYAFFPENKFNINGMISQAESFMPSENGVIVYFDATGKLDAMIDKAVKAGGKVLRGKTKVEAEGRGYFALIADTENNRIGLYSNN